MPRNIFIVGLGESCLNLKVEGELSVLALTDRVCSGKAVDPSSFYLTHNGTPLADSDLVEVGEDYTTTVIKAHPIIRGGKGGFGSLIRAMGTQMNKGNKREACRDLSGRRMRDVNAEKKMAQWLKEEPERQRELREEKRKRLERKRAGPKHNYNDPTYMEQIRNTEETMDDALKQGLEASSSKSLKRKQPVANESSKKPKLWLGIDDTELDSDSDDDGEQGTSRSLQSLESDGSSDEVSAGSGSLGDEPGPSRSPEETHKEDEESSSDGRSGEVGEESKEGSSGQVSTPESEKDSSRQVKEGGSALDSEKPSIQQQPQLEEGGAEKVPLVSERGIGNSEEGPLVSEGGSGNSEEVPLVSEGGGGNSEEVPLVSEGGSGNSEKGPLVPEEGSGNSEGVPLVSKGGSGNSEKGPLVSERGSGNSEEVPLVSTEAEKPLSQDSNKQVFDDKPIDLEDFSSAVALESAGPERLKSALQTLGLKCGGTLQERAQRLFSTKGKKLEELDPSMFAKVGKKKKNK